MRHVLLALLGWSVLHLAAHAQDGPLIPPQRMDILSGVDLPGGDIAQMFDTTLDACQKACLTNAACTAFTFNARNLSCFPKQAPGPAEPYPNAISGFVLRAAEGAEARARTLRPQLDFIDDGEIAQARAQAETLGTTYPSNGLSASDLREAAAASERAGDLAQAIRLSGAATNLTDFATDWADHARLLLVHADRDERSAEALRLRATTAAINAYLRAESPALRHTVLVLMAEAMEKSGRGRDTVSALRLAQSLQARDDTARQLDDAIGKYGFRILDTQVQTDTPRPRICVSFSEDLAKAGVDYESYVRLPEAGLAATTDGERNLCIEGLSHGRRYTLTFREGLPAANGQTLAKPVEITSYVRDRAPLVRFPGRAYVLPRGDQAALPVVTVNTDKLDLTLFRVTDRNLTRAFQNGYFGQPMAEWQEPDFDGEIGSEIWSGSATVPVELNRDITTRLPMAEALEGQPPGIYALRAAVPGTDPYEVASAWQWFVVSDLGLTTLTGVDGLHVFVRSLGTAAAKPGVRVELISRANEVLGTVQTDAMGHARFEPGLTRGTGGQAMALVVARDAETTDMSFLSLTDPEFDLSDRGVAGRAPAPPVDVFLATDRGAYRAGETVHVTALARDSRAEAVPGLPLTAILKRPDGVEYSRQLAPESGAGGYVFALPIAANAPRGSWRLEVLADLEAPPLASRTFLVEDFLPERIDFALTFPEEALRAGERTSVSLSARYLFGAPAADLSVEGEVLLRAASGLEGYSGYVFGPHDEPIDARIESLGGIRTGTDGTAVIDLALPGIKDPMRPLEAVFTLRVAEGSGRPVERRETRPLLPVTPMIGIKPMFEDAVPEGSEARFSLIGLDAGGAGAKMPVTWTVSRIETEYQWYQTYGNWAWEPVTTRSIVAEGRLDLGTVATEIAVPVAWGQYELRVQGAEGQRAQTSTLFNAGWYAAADVAVTPDMLDLSLDARAYKTGDTALLRIVPRAAGTAIVTVLSNRLIAMQAMDLKEGENTLALPVTDDWGSGVYVTASALRPMDRAAGRNPGRALGLTHASIDPGDRQLRPTLDIAVEVAPRGPLPIALKVDGARPGETVHATIAAVDQGILNLTAFAPPNPSAHYFGQRRLGVGIRDVYGRLIDGLNGTEGQVRSGGDAGAQARLQSTPPTEELVAFFSGALLVGADGYARTSFDLPAFNGTVKVMAIVWSRTGVGQIDADVLVRDPVVVTASLPRFLAPGDQSRLLLEIVHSHGPSGHIGLDVAGRGVTLGTVPPGIDLSEKGKVVLAIPVSAKAPGTHMIDVVLTTPDGKVLTKTISLPVQSNDPEVSRTSRLTLATGETMTLGQDLFDGLAPGTGRATLAVGPLARLDAPGLLAALNAYPYGCTEQIASKALPLLYLDEVAQAMDLPGESDIRDRIDRAVTEILSNQGAEGSFGLWAPGSGDLWLDSYVTDFLSRARASGFAVPDVAFRQAIDNLRNRVNYAPDFDAATNGGGEDLAYALMVLAREGAAAIGDLRYYADVKADDFRTALAQAQLGAALASYGDQTRADAMFRRAAARTDDLLQEDTQRLWRSDYGTQFRDAAAILTLAAESGTAAVDRDALAGHLAGHAGPLSTQETAWALMAANALIDRPDSAGVEVDGAAATGPQVRMLSPGSAPVTIHNSGPATQITLTSFGVPEVPGPAMGNGYAIDRSYFRLDGSPAALDSLRTGDRLVTVIEVTPFGQGEARLMINDPLPAGFEIDNPNLISAGALANLDWLDPLAEVTHSEFRQDRFLTAVHHRDGRPFRLAYIVRAISPGTFHHPAASVEDMYRPAYRATGVAGRITIAE